MSKSLAQSDKSVLIVDDDAVCRYFCTQALTGLNHRILVAATAKSAIDLARAWQPALIVFDLHLREFSGEVVKANILEQWPSAVAPPVFVAMSGDNQRFREPGALAGISMFLPKPFSAGQLRALVNQVLGQCPASAFASVIPPVSTADQLERALRAEWAAGLAELDQQIAALDWSKATYTLHRLCGAAAVAGHAELAQGARKLMKEITEQAFGVEMTSAYADFLWQGAGFAMESEQAAPFRHCESVGPFP